MARDRSAGSVLLLLVAAAGLIQAAWCAHTPEALPAAGDGTSSHLTTSPQPRAKTPSPYTHTHTHHHAAKASSHSTKPRPEAGLLHAPASTAAATPHGTPHTPAGHPHHGPQHKHAGSVALRGKEVSARMLKTPTRAKAASTSLASDAPRASQPQAASRSLLQWGPMWGGGSMSQSQAQAQSMSMGGMSQAQSQAQSMSGGFGGSMSQAQAQAQSFGGGYGGWGGPSRYWGRKLRAMLPPAAAPSAPSHSTAKLAGTIRSGTKGWREAPMLRDATRKLLGLDAAQAPEQFWGYGPQQYGPQAGQQYAPDGFVPPYMPMMMPWAPMPMPMGPMVVPQAAGDAMPPGGNTAPGTQASATATSTSTSTTSTPSGSTATATGSGGGSPAGASATGKAVAHGQQATNAVRGSPAAAKAEATSTSTPQAASSSG